LIHERSLAQCPRGYVTAESMAWIDQFYRIKGASKASNSPYFAAIETADPVTVSVFELLERESNFIDAEIRDVRANAPR
jgi:hypothetical protein